MDTLFSFPNEIIFYSVTWISMTFVIFVEAIKSELQFQCMLELLYLLYQHLESLCE